MVLGTGRSHTAGHERRTFPCRQDLYGGGSNASLDLDAYGSATSPWGTSSTPKTVFRAERDSKSAGRTDSIRTT